MLVAGHKTRLLAEAKRAYEWERERDKCRNETLSRVRIVKKFDGAGN